MMKFSWIIALILLIQVSHAGNISVSNTINSNILITNTIKQTFITQVNLLLGANAISITNQSNFNFSKYQSLSANQLNSINTIISLLKISYPNLTNSLKITSQNMTVNYGSLSNGKNYVGAGKALYNYTKFDPNTANFTIFKTNVNKAQPYMKLNINSQIISDINKTVTIHPPVVNGHLGITGPTYYPLNMSFDSDLLPGNPVQFSIIVRVNGTQITNEVIVTNSIHTNILYNMSLNQTANIIFDEIGNQNYSAVDPMPSIVPTNMKFYRTITLVNKAASAWPANTPINITVNTIPDNAFIVENAMNVEFAFSNGTVIRSQFWANVTANALQTCQGTALFVSCNNIAAASWWLNSTWQLGTFLRANGLAGSVNTIYMYYAGNFVGGANPAANDLYDGSTVGAAPWLSASGSGANQAPSQTCTGLDNGAKIFGYWNSWCGLGANALATGWSKINSMDASSNPTNTILLMGAATPRAELTITVAMPMNTIPFAWDFVGNQWDSPGIATATYVATDGTAQAPTTPTATGIIATSGTPTQKNIGEGNRAGANTITHNLAGDKWYTFQQDTTTAVNVIINGGGVSSKTQLATRANGLETDAQAGGAFFEIFGGGATSNAIIYAIAGRNDPPNGVMANVLIGGFTSTILTPTLTVSNSVAVDVNQYQTFTATSNGGNLNFAYSYNAVNSISSFPVVSKQIFSGVALATNSYTIQVPQFWVTNSPMMANVQIIDGASQTVNSVYTATFTVSNVLQNQQIIVMPTTGITSGTEIELTGNWLGGTSSYTANFFITNATTGAILASALYSGLTGTTNTFNFTIGNTAKWQGVRNIKFTISDSASTIVSNTITNTVGNPAGSASEGFFLTTTIPQASLTGNSPSNPSSADIVSLSIFIIHWLDKTQLRPLAFLQYNGKMASIINIIQFGLPVALWLALAFLFIALLSIRSNNPKLLNRAKFSSAIFIIFTIILLVGWFV